MFLRKSKNHVIWKWSLTGIKNNASVFLFGFRTLFENGHLT